MNSDLIYQEVVKVISETLRIDPALVTPTARLKEDLDATSLDLITVAMDMEQKYGKEIFEEDAKEFATVSDLVEYVRSRFITFGITP